MSAAPGGPKNLCRRDTRSCTACKSFLKRTRRGHSLPQPGAQSAKSAPMFPMPAWSYVHLGLVLVTSPCHSLLEHDVLAPAHRYPVCNLATCSPPPDRSDRFPLGGRATCNLATCSIRGLAICSNLATCNLAARAKWIGPAPTSLTTSVQTLQKVRAMQDMQYGFPPLR